MIAPVKHRRVRRVDVKDLKLSDSGDVFEDRTTRFRSSMQTRNDTQHTQREQTVYNRPSSRINRNKNLPSAYGESAVSAISVPPENMPEMRARHDNAFGKYTGDLLQSASSRLMQEIQAAGFEQQQDLMQHFMASPRNSLRKNAGGCVSAFFHPFVLPSVLPLIRPSAHSSFRPSVRPPFLRFFSGLPSFPSPSF
jgi:hypothetical protein